MKYAHNRSKLHSSDDRYIGGFRVTMPINIVIYEYALPLLSQQLDA